MEDQAPYNADYHELKHDKDKLDWSLLDLSLIKPIVRVLMYGLEKYKSRDSWKTVPDAKERYYSALIRHVEAYRRGEWLDKESLLPHLWLAFCNLYFLIWFERRKDKKI